MKPLQNIRSAIHGGFSDPIIKPTRRFFGKEAAGSLLPKSAGILILALTAQRFPGTRKS